MSNNAILFYSTIMALLSLAALAIAVGLVVYRVVRGPDAGALLSGKTLWLAWIVASVATIGSLIYSEVIHFEPCRLCWFQRIAMYPLSVILLVGAWRKELQIKYYALPFALGGLAISTYHYLIQTFPNLEGGSCDPDNPCSNIFVHIFEFITIPFMAGSGFILIAVLLGLYVNNKATVE
jgi:disulfide bond formation protein DsbB